MADDKKGAPLRSFSFQNADGLLLNSLDPKRQIRDWFLPVPQRDIEVKVMKNSVRLERYFRIYDHLCTDPFIQLYKIKNAGVSRSSVSRYLKKIYELSIIKGSMILLKPAVNYKEYVGFLRFKNARSVYVLLKEFPKSCNLSPPLYWKKDEWTLYHIFKSNMQKKVTPLLRKNRIRYETFTKWKNSLVDYCTVHTEFYPDGYNQYLRYSFLLSTDYPEKVKLVFSFFPATPIFMELDNHLFAILSVESPGCIKAFFRSIFAMKAKKMINEFKTAIMIKHDRM